MKIKLYTTSMCPYCVMEKEFLKANKITFTEVNVGTDNAAANEMIQKSGQTGVPVTIIQDGKGDKEAVIVGFNREALKKALKIK